MLAANAPRLVAGEHVSSRGGGVGGFFEAASFSNICLLIASVGGRGLKSCNRHSNLSNQRYSFSQEAQHMLGLLKGIFGTSSKQDESPLYVMS
jgi:hypothetical protein